MESFTLSLTNEAQVSGLLSIPSRTSTTPYYRPLIVGLHGGTYFSSYFANETASSALRIAASLGVPFISVDRPGYKDSTALPTLPAGSTFLQEEGKYLHQHILPAIWQAYGAASEATTVVILAHSLGAPGAIVAAALHAREQQQHTYPCGGLIMSGWGTVHARPREAAKHMMDTLTVNGRINWPLEHKDAPMFGATPEELALRVSPDVLALTSQLDHSMSRGEIEDGTFTWLDYWLDYAKDVQWPIMYGMAQHDALWKTTRENVEDFARAFTSSQRVERGVVLEAPHCMELSYWGPGWIARCIGFAIECAAAEGVKRATQGEQLSSGI
ncbi:hypothetical protein G647_03198 [Cladophialophora carrionii CBS 160.54]|uniref:AB hydrolase-1 domain-containing protein n=1 Tax=Cladophialophora carrionii CBS 160.54 TaxID=1279043 RepID=V9DID6_9EURO|nr:uncharacterized protein G647_03198 [Cladophialophora carrionii CBS 160.54]ETI26421.1 hypothetical protein G647_03198 [Cladophialophora carrionii CBS 160.54]